jgi:hypothetical protein
LLAREGVVSRDGKSLFHTPLLVPSFSSKGFPEVKKIIAVMEEFITDAVLVSAYDAHYNEINPITLTFPSIVFLDSGGYEARVEHDLSEAYGKDYKPRPWSGVDHRQVLREWEMSVPTIAVSFDSPRRHTSVTKQVKAALSLKEEFPLFVHELLIKPEKTGQYIEIESIKTVLDQLAQFPIIGFTERELDTRIIGRMEKVATIRRLLDDAGISSPIHIFGSLDTLSTVLYFLAGAEIFDGLTWLRFGYHKGQTIYSQNYGAIRGENGILKNARELSHAMWKDNYYYLESLRDQMRNFVRTRDYKHFEHIASQVELAFHQLESRLLS